MEAALSLRVMDVADISVEYLNALNAVEVVEFTDLRHRSTDRSDAIDFIQVMQRSPCDCLWGIFADKNELIGTVRLGPIEFPNLVYEIGILLFSENWQGKGIGRAVISKVCSDAGEYLGLMKFTAGVLRENNASVRAFEASGFERECCQVSQEVLRTGQRTDVLLFGRSTPPKVEPVNDLKGVISMEWPPESKWKRDLPHYQARLQRA